MPADMRVTPFQQGGLGLDAAAVVGLAIDNHTLSVL
jgi:hypothetical protein